MDYTIYLKHEKHPYYARKSFEGHLLCIVHIISSRLTKL
jgi:hypothetical protein